jgi:hypothetical protein
MPDTKPDINTSTTPPVFSASNESYGSWAAIFAISLRLLIIPAAVVAFLIFAVLLVFILRWTNLVDGVFIAIALIGCMGGIGGSVAAARDGTLKFPHYDRATKSIYLGSLQESVYGAVGSFAIFLVAPGISEEALDLGRASFGPLGFQWPPDRQGPSEAFPARDSSADRGISPGEPQQMQLRPLGFLQPADPPDASANLPATTPRLSAVDPSPARQSVDWLELIAISLVGGYAGRALITRAVQTFVTREEVEQAKNEVQQKSEELVEDVRTDLEQEVQQRQHDQEALKMFLDQADIYTPPPNPADLQNAIKQASPKTHEQIYVESRRAFHAIINLAELGMEAPRVQELKRRIAERMIPVMQTLVDIDAIRRYRGCRYGLALAFSLTGRHREAWSVLQEALEISRTARGSIPAEYTKLEADLAKTLEQPATPAPSPAVLNSEP